GGPAGGGYAGVTGNSGYLEASGNPSTQQAAVYGSTTDGSVTGQANVSSSGPGVCANGVTAPQGTTRPGGVTSPPRRQDAGMAATSASFELVRSPTWATPTVPRM